MMRLAVSLSTLALAQAKKGMLSIPKVLSIMEKMDINTSNIDLVYIHIHINTSKSAVVLSAEATDVPTENDNNITKIVAKR